MANLNQKLFKNSLEKAINQAGPRYTPGFKGYSNFPSIPIGTLIKSFDGLERNDAFWERFRSFKSSILYELKHNWGLRPSNIPDSIKQIDSASCRMACKILQEDLNRILNLGDPSFASIKYTKTLKDVRICCTQLDNAQSIIFKKLHATKTKGKTDLQRSELENFNSYFIKLIQLTSEIEDFLLSQTIDLSNKPFGLLLGVGGTGKTHILCDIAKSRVKAKKPTITMLAKNMILHDDLWQSLLLSLGLRCRKKTLFKFLQQKAIARNARALIIIDGINESDRLSWRNGLKKVLEEIEPYSEIAVLLSCRSPFQREIVKKRLFKKFVVLEHRGFHEIEFDAQTEFFRYYDLNLYEVPLLSEEFSNPLFLKIFCESIVEAIVKKQHRQIKEISSGQKGMTYIFEKFVRSKQHEISQVLDKKSQKKIFIIDNWLWNKGKTVGLVKDFTTKMVRDKADYISYMDYLYLLNSYLVDKKYAEEIKIMLLSSGIFFEDMIWDKNSYQTVIRISYQKFSDHLLARTILQETNCMDRNAIKTMLNLWIKNRSLFEALIIDFPMRSNGKELLDYIDKQDLVPIICELFIEGLHWRDSKAFNKSTLKWINKFINNSNLRNSLLDVIFSLATKHNHPLGANVFNKFLMKMKMPERDLLWTEYIRNYWSEGSILRVLVWAESVKWGLINPKSTENYLNLIKWLLCSTNKYIRDRTTKSIYDIGQKHPSILFKTTIDSLKINDPYIPERMLAASYGVAMTLHNNRKNKAFINKILPEYACGLYKSMFAPKARFVTTHILMRDYARLSIEIVMLSQSKLFKKNQVKRIKPPFKDGGIRRWGKSDDQTKNGGYPIHMDFENYTIGRLVRDRDNYDYDNEDYKTAKSNILWRIYNLGYDASKFKNIDREIADRFFYSRNEQSKTERYGKKYSWIAFFELYGFRQDKGLIDSFRYGYYDRPSDSDIDPSFPGLPNGYKYLKRNLIGHSTHLADEWIEEMRFPPSKEILVINSTDNEYGPWLALYGSVKQDNILINKRSKLFIHGLMVKKKEIKNLLSALKFGSSHLHDIQSIPSLYYTYAGEIPWCDTFPKNEPHEIWFSGYSKSGNNPSIEVNVPTIEYAWESYHSSFNKINHIVVPAKKLCDAFDLSLKLPAWEFINSNDEICAKYFRQEFNNETQELSVIKKDLVDDFLRDNKLALVWIMVLERQILSSNQIIKSKSKRRRKTFKVKAKVFQYYNGKVKEKFTRGNL